MIDSSDSADSMIRSGWSKRANGDLKIPKRYRFKGLAAIDGRVQELRTARRAISQGRGVYLWGPCGTGKTHIAVGLLLDWYAGIVTSWTFNREPGKTHQRGMFVSMGDLLLELKETFGAKHGESKLMRSYKELDLMLIDDLGAERMTDWARQVVSDLIVMRHRDMSQTIITSNFDLEGIAKNIDDRVASRIGEMCEVIKLDGTDRRLEVEQVQPRLAIGE